MGEWWGGAYHVVHDGATVYEEASVGAPLDMVDLCAIRRVIGAVEDVILIINESNVGGPLVSCRCPIGICLVAGISVETRGKLKECPGGKGVLVVVSVVECEDLPFQAPSARTGIPARSLTIKHCLR